MLEVYDADFLNVIFIPQGKILHTPPKSMGVTRLVLCRNFDERLPDSSCSKSSACKFVHAVIDGCKKHPIHVNYAWRNLEAVTYPRLPPGDVVSVLAPNDRPPADDVPSERILVTRGSTARREGASGGLGAAGAKQGSGGSISHCAHYYFNRMCNRGDRCNFIHSVHIDPNATAWQRAPAPTAVAPLHRGGGKLPGMGSSQEIIVPQMVDKMQISNNDQASQIEQQMQPTPPAPQHLLPPPVQQQQVIHQPIMMLPQHQQHHMFNGQGHQVVYQPIYVPMMVPTGPLPIQQQQQQQQFVQLPISHQQQFLQQQFMPLPQHQQFLQISNNQLQPHQYQQQYAAQPQFMQPPQQPSQQFVPQAQPQTQQQPSQQFVPQAQPQTQQQPSMTSFFVVPPSSAVSQQGALDDQSVGGRSGMLAWSNHGPVFNGSMSASSSTASMLWR